MHSQDRVFFGTPPTDSAIVGKQPNTACMRSPVCSCAPVSPWMMPTVSMEDATMTVLLMTMEMSISTMMMMAGQQGCSMLGSMTCWATLPIWSKPEQTQCCMTTSIKQKERVGGSLVVHLAVAVVEAVPGCVIPSL